MELGEVPVGAQVVVVAVSAPAARARRLAELGLRVGARVDVLRRTAGRGRLLGVGEDRLAVGSSVLRELLVEQGDA